METKINNELELLGPFCDINPNHPEMNTPFYHPKYKEVWATNGHILIRIPPERLVEEYDKFDRLTLPELGELCHKRLSLDALKRALDKLPTKHFTTCPECDGYGNVEWEYHDKDDEYHRMEEECPVSTPEIGIRQHLCHQPRKRKISTFSDKSDGHSSRYMRRRYAFCRFLANYSFKTPPFLFANQSALERSSHSTKVQQKSPQLTGLQA